jgi:hypothetical protein
MFLICDLLHDPVAAAVLAVTVGVPHASVAVAVPNARSIADAEGLHPSVKLFPEVENCRCCYICCPCSSS